MNNIPLPLMSFLNYMETIKGISKNTVNEYYYDLRTFFRYLKVQRGLVPKTAGIQIRSIPLGATNPLAIATAFTA
jgi:integrase/recombinase XerD